MAEESGHCCLGELNKKPEQKFDPASHPKWREFTPPVCVVAFLYALGLRVASCSNTPKGHGARWGEDTELSSAGKTLWGVSRTPGDPSTG